MRDWEETFRNWARPPTEAETSRCENTIRMVREAIAQSSSLNRRNVRAFVQGSYRNNTNVPRESDVDVGVVCYDTFYYDLPPNTQDATFGIEPATYLYNTFKDELGEALVKYFGPGTVTRGNKAFDIRASRSQVEADVAPFFEHRRYNAERGHLSGVELRPDNGLPPRIINWPEQHYENGTSKNTITGHRYKGQVRILKSLRNEMIDQGHSLARPIIGFLNECLIWNVPNNLFGMGTYTDDFRGVMRHLIGATSTPDGCGEWGEVSELKYLFRGTQAWTREQAHAFLVEAMRHTGLT